MDGSPLQPLSPRVDLDPSTSSAEEPKQQRAELKAPKVFRNGKAILLIYKTKIINAFHFYKKKIQLYHLNQEDLFKLIPIFFLLIGSIVYWVVREVISPPSICLNESATRITCRQEWWIFTVVFDSCPENLMNSVLTPLLFPLAILSMGIFLVTWLSIALMPYLWYLAISGNWEKVTPNILSPLGATIINTILVSLMMAMDIQNLLGLLFPSNEYGFWKRPQMSPAETGGFPSGHAVFAGAITVLHPYSFPLAILLTLSRILMNYHSPFQCLVGYILGALVINPIHHIIDQPAFVPIATSAMFLKLVARQKIVSPFFELAPFILSWFPILLQVVEPY